MNTRIYIFILGLFVCNYSNACFTPPSVYSRPYSEVIDGAQVIFLATAISVNNNSSDVVDSEARQTKQFSNVDELLSAAREAQNQNNRKTRYEFSIKEVLRGDVPATNYSIYGYPLENNNNSHFNNHSDYRFWLDGSGRIGVRESCDLNIYFQVGEDYLIMLDQRNSYKSFELINNVDEDMWLQEVKRRI